jgi:hypothetical protein
LWIDLDQVCENPHLVKIILVFETAPRNNDVPQTSLFSIAQRYFLQHLPTNKKKGSLQGAGRRF